MAEYTSTQAAGVAKAVHAGSQAVVGTIAPSAALSVGDVLNIVKLPRGAKIEDIEFVGACVGTLAVFNVGDAGSASRHGAVSFTASTEYKTPTTHGIGFQFRSISDDANDWLLKMTCATATSISAGGSFTCQVRYHIDAN